MDLLTCRINQVYYTELSMVENNDATGAGAYIYLI